MQYEKYRDSHLVREVNELIKLDRKDVDLLQQEWNATERENRSIYEAKTELYKSKVLETENYLTGVGIKVFKYDRRSNKVYEKWFLSNIKSPLHTSIVGYSTPSKPSTDILSLYDKAKREKEWAASVRQKQDKLLVESIKKAGEFGIDTENLSSEEIIKKVEEVAKAKFEEEKYPAGTEISIDDNYCECESYTIGDRRCSCGNRRISHWIEGDIVDGFYLQTEPY